MHTIASKPRSFIAKMTIGKRDIKITLPKNVTKEVSLTGKSVYCTLIDGVLQVSGEQPNVVIPAITLDSHKFIPQI